MQYDKTTISTATALLLTALLLTALLSSGCGGDEPEAQTARAEPATSGDEQTAPKKDEPQIEGLMGTLSQFAIDSGLQPRMGRFARCFAGRSSDVEMIGGRIELTFRVALDGTVKWVYPQRSTIGDRATEKCILEIASNVKFRSPSGGEAEFTWPLEFDPPENVRPATPWDAGRLADVLDTEAETVLETCRPAGEANGFTVTAYVAPGGQVLAAGAAVDKAESKEQEALDCVAEHVQGWEMPDPGSYPAKVTFELE